MKILFVHNNFPAQFRNLATALSSAGGVEMAAIGCETAKSMNGVDVHRYRTPNGQASAHSFARRFDHECRRAEEVLYLATGLSNSGFKPDVIFVHPGWGENIPLRTVFPKAKIILYCEFYYRREGGDVGFDPEFLPMGLDGYVGLEARNAASLIGLASADFGVSPTQWQKSTFPSEFQSKITVIHDGIDTDLFSPNPRAFIELPSGAVLTAQDEVLTYSARDLEPIRGFHIFMRALPKILAERSNAQVVIVGADGVSYGQPPRKDPTWKAAMLRELGDALDLERIHFTGRLRYGDYLKVLQISTAHIYLTYPFVLSWSMIEALSAGCMVIASDTPPVREIIDGSNGIRIPFFSIDQLAEAASFALEKPDKHRHFRDQARKTAQQRFDNRQVCLPQLVKLLREI
jgi:glycosyltransferase involved in cell wall biosynthesis